MTLRFAKIEAHSSSISTRNPRVCLLTVVLQELYRDTLKRFLLWVVVPLQILQCNASPWLCCCGSNLAVPNIMVTETSGFQFCKWHELFVVLDDAFYFNTPGKSTVSYYLIQFFFLNWAVFWSSDFEIFSGDSLRKLPHQHSLMIDI